MFFLKVGKKDFVIIFWLFLLNGGQRRRWIDIEVSVIRMFFFEVVLWFNFRVSSGEHIQKPYDDLLNFVFNELRAYPDHKPGDLTLWRQRSVIHEDDITFKSGKKARDTSCGNVEKPTRSLWTRRGKQTAVFHPLPTGFVNASTFPQFHSFYG